MPRTYIDTDQDSLDLLLECLVQIGDPDSDNHQRIDRCYQAALDEFSAAIPEAHTRGFGRAHSPNGMTPVTIRGQKFWLEFSMYGTVHIYRHCRSRHHLCIRVEVLKRICEEDISMSYY